MDLATADLILVRVRLVAQELIKERLRDGYYELVAATGEPACTEARLIECSLVELWHETI